jgi:hypothetical protein
MALIAARLGCTVPSVPQLAIEESRAPPAARARYRRDGVRSIAPFIDPKTIRSALARCGHMWYLLQLRAPGFNQLSWPMRGVAGSPTPGQDRPDGDRVARLTCADAILLRALFVSHNPEVHPRSSSFLGSVVRWGS